MIIRLNNLRYVDYRWIMKDNSDEFARYYGKEVEFRRGGDIYHTVIYYNGATSTHFYNTEVRIQRLYKDKNPEYWL